jgi:YgiT-type zinc finger domain-containing protein
MKRSIKESCDNCDGTLHARHVRVVRSRGRKVVIIEDVPANVCNKCGTRYYDASTVRSMEVLLKRSRSYKRSIKVPVTKFEGVA